MTQLGALIFLNLGALNLPFTHLLGVCAPVFYCHGCPLATMACPIGVLVNFSTLRVFPFLALGILGLVGTIGGRLVCGWLCPFGMIQDLLYKIPTKKIKIPRAFNYAKYGILVGLVFAVPYFLPGQPYTFCHFCPSGTLEASIPWELRGVASSGGSGAHAARLIILGAVLLLGVIATRSWCKTLCPLGAIFSFFNKFSIFRFRLATHECKGCGVCLKKCPVEIDPVADMNTAECIRCADCTTTDHIKLGMR